MHVESFPVVSPQFAFVRRLFRRPLTVVCCAYLALVIVIAVFAPIALPEVAHQHAGNLLATKQGPSWEHPLGTDTLGRDVLDRLLVGTRVTMFGVLEAILVSLFLGVPLGLLAGYLGGRTDRAVSWLADLTFSMPAIVIVIVVLSVFPGSMAAAMVTLGVLLSPALMRIVRSAALPIREEPYIAAARVSGLKPAYIMRNQILPRISGPIIVQTSLLAAAALLTQTGLAFLNLVVAAPAPSWGGMVADGVSVIVLQPWLIWPPGLAIVATILVLGLLGDAVRDASVDAWSPSPTSARKRNANGRVTWTSPRAPSPVSRALLSVEELSVSFRKTDRGNASTVVDAISFELDAGEVVGLVGESGSGKTMTALAILGLLPSGGETDGSVVFDSRDLLRLGERELASVRGAEIALVSQEPMTSFSPIFRVGTQLAQAVRRHQDVPRRDVKRRVLGLLEAAQLDDPVAVSRSYPYELSGGMLQRVAIARALAGKPRLLIADEPTTALDVTVQAEILGLFRSLRETHNLGLLLVTHDWGVIADLCDRAVVMYAGQIVEGADVDSLFQQPRHPYTEALLAANPHHVGDQETLPAIPGSVPSPERWPTGCHFNPRCRYATAECRIGAIPTLSLGAGRLTRCIHHDQLAA